MAHKDHSGAFMQCSTCNTCLACNPGHNAEACRRKAQGE